MAFEFGEQKDSAGNITHSGSWGLKSPTMLDVIVKIVENFRAIMEDGIVKPDMTPVEAAIAAEAARANAYTDGACSALVNSSPEALNTLYELANALGNDPAFSTTVMNLIGTKAPIANPVFSGTIMSSGSGIFGYEGTGSAARNGIAIGTHGNYSDLVWTHYGGETFSVGVDPATDTSKLSIRHQGSEVASFIHSGFNVAGSLLAYDGTKTLKFSSDSGLETDTWFIIHNSSMGSVSHLLANDANNSYINGNGYKLGIGGITDPKATLHATGNTILGCATGNVWSDIGNLQFQPFVNNNVFGFSIKDANGNEYSIHFTLPAPGAIKTL